MADQDVRIRVRADARQAQAAMDRLTRSVVQLDAQMKRLNRTMGQYETQQKAATTETVAAATAMTRLATAAGTVTVAIGATVAAYVAFNLAVARAAEPVNLLEERLNNLTGNDGAFQKFVEVANETGRTLQETGVVASRFAIGMEELGATTPQIAELTRTIFQLARISGTATSEFAAGTLQFAQGVVSGRFAGDELKSVFENLPALARTLADELGVTLETLREMGAEGELTGPRIFDAMLRASKAVNEEFEQLSFTFTQSANVVANEWALLIQAIDRAVGASPTAQAILELASGALREIRLSIDVSEAAQLNRLLQDVESQIRDLQGISVAEDIERVLDQDGTDPRLGNLFNQRARILRRLSQIEQEQREKDEAEAAKARQQRRANEAREEAKRIAEFTADAERDVREVIRQEAIQQEQDRLQAIEDSRRQEQEYLQESLRLEDEKTQRIREAWDERQRAAIEAAEAERQLQEDTFRAYSDLATGIGDLTAEAFGENAEATKAIRLAEALINTYAGANAVLAEPTTPFALKVVQAAAIIAQGLANVARIRNVNTSARASGGDVRSGRPYRINEMGPEMYTDGGGRQFLLPATDGRVSPLSGGTSSSGPSVRVINNGPPLQVESTRQVGDTTEVIVAQAVAAVRQDFNQSLSSGYGTYASALQTRYGVRRRI